MGQNIYFYSQILGACFGLFGPCCSAVAPNPTLRQPRDSADTVCWSFLNFFNPHTSTIVMGCLIYICTEKSILTYKKQSPKMWTQIIKAHPLSESWAPPGHPWRVLDIGTGSRAPPGAASQPQPTYKGQRSLERGIVACTTFTKMNSFVSPSIPFVIKSKDDCFSIPV